MPMDKRRRNHKITILSSMLSILKQSWFLVLMLATNDIGSFKPLLLALGLMFVLFLSFMQWRSTYFYIDEDKLHYLKGIVSKKNTAVPLGAISTVDFSQNVIQRLFEVVAIKVDSGANNLKGSELKIVLGKADAEELKGQLGNREAHETEHREKSKNVLVRMSPRDVAYYSLTQNNLPLVIGAVLSVLNFADDLLKLFGLEMEKLLDENSLFQNSGLSMEFLLKIGALMMAGLVIATICSMIYYALKYGNFTAVKDGRNIYIEYGLLSTKRYSFTLDKINAVIAKQNLLRRFLGLYKVHVSIIGYGDDKGEEAVISPICSSEGMTRLVGELNPDLKFEGETYMANTHGRNNFFIMPIIAALGAGTAGFVLTRYGFWWFLILPATFLARFLKYRNTSLGYSDRVLVATSGVFSKETLLVEMAKVQSLTKKTNFFQRTKKLCTYKVQYYSQSFGGNVTLKHLEDRHFNSLKNILVD